MRSGVKLSKWEVDNERQRKYKRKKNLRKKITKYNHKHFLFSLRFTYRTDYRSTFYELRSAGNGDNRKSTLFL